MEYILSIEEIYDVQIKDSCEEHENVCDCSTRIRSYDGYKIMTNHQKILFIISNDQNCCEVWGYITSEDDLQYFVGSELRRISVDCILDSVITRLQKLKVDIDDAIFINLSTSKGVLQFVLYNSHNGYYGHRVKIISEKLNVDEIL